MTRLWGAGAPALWALLGFAGCVTAPPPDAWLEVEVAHGLASASEAKGGLRVEVVLDVTPSMAFAQTAQPAKLEGARNAAARFLRSLPEDVPASLVVLGASGPACEATPLVLGPETGSAAVLALRAEHIQPVAEASLSSTLESVANALVAEEVAERTRVVVFSDLGAECGGDRCAAAQKLLTTGATLDLVVFGDAEVPACLRSLPLPSAPPAAVASRTDTEPYSFRVLAAPTGPERTPAQGVAGQGALRLDPGPAVVEVAMDPPLALPVQLSAGTLMRLRVIDFPAVTPPAREWLFETEAPPSGTPAPAGGQ